MATPPVQLEVIDDMTANILSRKSEADRWDMACELMRFMRQMMADGVRDIHSDWSPEQVEREVARRIRLSHENQ